MLLEVFHITTHLTKGFVINKSLKTMQQLFLKALLTTEFHFPAGKGPGALFSSTSPLPALGKLQQLVKLWNPEVTPFSLCFVGTWPFKFTPKNLLFKEREKLFLHLRAPPITAPSSEPGKNSTGHHKFGTFIYATDFS